MRRWDSVTCTQLRRVGSGSGGNETVTCDERHQVFEFIDESWRASEGPTQDNNLICGLSSFTYDSAGTIHSREINIHHDEMNCGLVTDTITHGMGCARNVAHRLILIHNG